MIAFFMIVPFSLMPGGEASPCLVDRTATVFQVASASAVGLSAGPSPGAISRVTRLIFNARRFPTLAGVLITTSVLVLMADS
ncbi:hypothetical protein ES703_125868 [subsurface metagenome]